MYVACLKKCQSKVAQIVLMAVVDDDGLLSASLKLRMLDVSCERPRERC